jgi:tetratricopeptide (TPR) repeat protein
LQAINKFEEALQSMPENKIVLVHLADLFKSKGDFKAANKYYLNSLAVDNTVRFHIHPSDLVQDTVTLFKYASFLAYLNRVELADLYYTRALQNEPPSLNYLQDYAEFAAKYLKDLQKAELYFQKSIELAPNKPLVYHNYALFLIK